MKVIFNKDFHRQYKKVDVRIQNSVDERMRIFRRNPKDLELNNHALKKEWEGYKSIDITSDFRAVYKEMDLGEDTVAYFVALDTHDKLYKPEAQ